MAGPVRIQLSRRKGWRMPENTAKVDRSTKWGNPYKAGVHCDHQHAVDCHYMLVKTGTEARSAPTAESSPIAYYAVVSHEISELRGKNLACWCAVNAPCHADVLLEIANRPICEEVA